MKIVGLFFDFAGADALVQALRRHAAELEATMKLALGVFLLSVLSASPAAAKHWHENDKHWNKHWDDRDDDERGRDHHAAGCYFEPHDVRIIREYYEPRYRNLPPGLAKKFARRGHLPPGWEKRMEPLPVAVERELVVLPLGYRRGYIDGSIVVYMPTTEVVIDVAPIVRR